MKRITVLLSVLLLALVSAAQTLSITTDDGVTYRFPAAQTGDMTYSEGTSLTVMGKTFALSDVSRMIVDAMEVTPKTISVSYDGSSADIVVAGDIAKYITPSVKGAHVCIAQSDDVEEEITYILDGSSSDGEFYMSGSYKATVELRGLTLTNASPVFSGAAICIMNGKRIALSVKNETENTLTDCANPSETLAQKAALYCKGHLELKGEGTLNVNGKYAHGIKSAEYMQLKNATVNIISAIQDGLSCDEYFLMESGNLTVKGVGDDAIQCDIDGTATGETTNHEGEDSGNIYIEGGTLTLTTTKAGAKCVKADSTIVIKSGTMNLNASGSVDTSNSSDPSYVAALKGGKVIISGGTVSATVKGSAGRGISAYDVLTDGGEIDISNSAGTATVSSDTKGAKGIKGLNVALNAGSITITMTGSGGKGIVAGDGTKTTSGGGGGPWGGGGPGGSRTTWKNIKGSYTQGLSDGTGPTLSVTTSGSYSNSSAKAIKAICPITLYGGTTEISTSTRKAEGLESKSTIDIKGGKHYLKCYDDCISSAGKVTFDGGVTVAYSTGNDAIDSNAGTAGAITIGNGAVMAYMIKGDPDEAFDCDNNSYIRITGTGIAIGAGGAQGSSTGTISNAAQGYKFAGTVSYKANVYNTLSDESGKNLVTFQLPVSITSKCTLVTAKGMVKNATYYIKSSTSEPTDATTVWHGLYLGSSASGTTSVTSFKAN
ncbi:MAG: carbohydrate-binding domain-containing protein [Bacteroidaceae bacterium]|nr:carbohydrate-binding domain-containing protein [Bacteroidaceae bacterium]